MQEEVTQKTMALAITTSRMTASVLAKAMRKFLEGQKNKSHQLPKGKQTIKELMKHYKMKELETDRSETDGIQNEKETKIGMDTEAVELEQYEGLWHTVEEVENSNASLFDEAERKAAYQIEATGQFFFIQETEEGADLTACRKIDSEMFQEQVERAEYFPQKSYEVLKPLMESEEHYEGELTPTS